MVNRLQKVSQSLLKARDYITLVAYAVVLADVLELAKEVTTEYLMTKRFKNLVHKEIRNISDNDIAEWTKAERKSHEVENAKNEVTPVTSRAHYVTNVTLDDNNGNQELPLNGRLSYEDDRELLSSPPFSL